MLFNSLEFVVFFPVVVAVYFLLPFRFRWAWLLLCSYAFYMVWNVPYVLLLLASTAVDYWAGLNVAPSKGRGAFRRKMFLLLSLVANFGILGVFKYFNFFSASLNRLLETAGVNYVIPHLDVLLPLGISFYTFQTLSYTLDVYRGKMAPQKHLGVFALYVAFFPQLVAGPIERATHLLPQFFKKHEFDYERACDGFKLMLWGFFQKIVIADRLAYFVNLVYGDPQGWRGLPVYLATNFFAFQIYCDFAGYSDIAIGAAKVMGFDIMENFRRPYFASSIADFWRRWHISLSTWFRDYLYIPLGGNRVSVRRWHFNLMVVFVVSGLWHGANWTFVVWGALHGLYMLGAIWTEDMRGRVKRMLRLDLHPGVLRFLQAAVTYHLVLLAWVCFRARTLGEAGVLVRNMLTFDIGTRFPYKNFDFIVSLGCIGLLLLVHGLQTRWRLRDLIAGWPKALRWSFYYFVFLVIIFLGKFEGVEFIYFQF